MQDHLSQAASTETPGRQFGDASLSERQFSASSPMPARAFYVTNPNYDSADPVSPTMIQDASATATPQRVQWTSADGLTTTGILNPFGLTKNNPSIGFNAIPANGVTS